MSSSGLESSPLALLTLSAVSCCPPYCTPEGAGRTLLDQTMPVELQGKRDNEHHNDNHHADGQKEAPRQGDHNNHSDYGREERR